MAIYSDAKLYCRANGTPTPLIKWFKNGNPLDTNNDPRIEIILEGTLSIKGKITNWILVSYVTLRFIRREILLKKKSLRRVNLFTAKLSHSHYHQEDTSRVERVLCRE